MILHVLISYFNKGFNTFSSLIASAVNFLIPAANCSTAIWSSFKSHRNLASVNSNFFKSIFCAASLLNFLETASVLAFNFPSRFGSIVRKSHPAKALISSERINNYIRWNLLPVLNDLLPIYHIWIILNFSLSLSLSLWTMSDYFKSYSYSH